MLNLIKEQDSESLIGKVYLYPKDLNESKYSAYMDDVLNNINDYNPRANRKILIVFYNMIADITTNKKFQALTKDLFIRCKKLNIYLIFLLRKKLD